MEKSIILTFIKFFDECIISKRMKKVKNWLQFITFLLALIFYGMFTNIIVNTDCKDISFSVVSFTTIIYAASIIMILFKADGRGLHDIIGRTEVIYDTEEVENVKEANIVEEKKTKKRKKSE